VAISVGVQKMVRSDLAASGVAFTLDPDTGFDKVVVINSIYGLGENIVQGRSTPDEFVLFKPHIPLRLQPDYPEKNRRKRMDDGVCRGWPSRRNRREQNYCPAGEKRDAFSLSDADVVRWVANGVPKSNNTTTNPWTLNGRRMACRANCTSCRPARKRCMPEKAKHSIVRTYQIKSKGKNSQKVSPWGENCFRPGQTCCARPKEGHLLQQGEVLVTDITNPDWDPIMKRAAAIVTNKGGRTSHAAIVARELGTVAIVGCGDATDKIHDGDLITVSPAPKGKPVLSTPERRNGRSRKRIFPT
jgi:pyruvate,water dikinase